MKKYLLNWMTVLMVAILSVGVLSCSEDDDNKKENEVSIVGTWRRDFSSIYYLLILKPNGTGLMEKYDSGRFEYSDEISYYFDKEKERYMIVVKDGEYAYTCPIQYYNETTLVWINPDDESETYTRVAK